MRKLIILLFMFAIFTACRTLKPPQIIERTTSIHDTVEKVRDTMIKIPADSAWLKALLECDKNGQIHIKQLTDYIAGIKMKPPEIQIKDNIITIKAKVDSTAVYAALKDRYVTSKETAYKEKKVEVNFLTGWQWAQVYAGRLLLLIGLIFIIYYIVIRSPVGGAIKNIIKK